MDAERLRAFLLTLPDVAETMQWGETLVYWVGDKTIGGKMFAVISLGAPNSVMSFAAGPEGFAELVEREGIFPAPYLARAHWVALKQWDTLPSNELKELLVRAREIVYARLPKRTKDVLAMPAGEKKKLIAARKKTLKARGKSR
jgi:predicted DNA-binding protein (MmcQ/YjbR family)